MIDRIIELADDMFKEYFYVNKLTEEEIDAKNNCSVESFAVGDSATFYLVSFKSTVIGSIYDDNEKSIVSTYTRKQDAQSNDNKDIKPGGSTIH